MTFSKLHGFIRAVLFGNKNYEIKSSTNILINQLLIDIKQYINIEETIRTGGLFNNHIIIMFDLDKIVKYIEKGNIFHLDKSIVKNNFDLNLESSIAKNFFDKLKLVCRGDLQNGAVSNKFKIEKNIIPEGSDRESLENILRNRNDLTFKNPEFWGNIAKQVLQYERPYILSTIETPIEYLKDVQTLYDVKCQTLGTIINPFSFAFVPFESHVDSMHWQSVNSIQNFIKYFPENRLSITIRALLQSVIQSIFDADENLLPSDVLDDDKQIRKFIKNIIIIHNRIEKVKSANTPTKLVDVFHRLLALLKLDYMWEQIDLSIPSKEEDYFLFHMFTKNIELKKENVLLRQQLMKSKKNSGHKNTCFK